MDKSERLAAELVAKCFEFAREETKTQPDHRLVSLDIFNAISTAIAVMIGTAVNPNIAVRGALIVLEHINKTVMFMVPEASRNASSMIKEFHEEDRLDTIWNKPATDDGKVS